MKKTLISIFVILLIILLYVISFIMNNQSEQNKILKQNKEYEYYLNKEIYGAEIATIINKVVDKNEQNKIPKNENGEYIDDGKQSIKVDLKMITIDKTYPMEVIYNNDITKFVQNFNLIMFKCTSIEYHKETGLISKITFEQIEE